MDNRKRSNEESNLDFTGEKKLKTRFPTYEPPDTPTDNGGPSANSSINEQAPADVPTEYTEPIGFVTTYLQDDMPMEGFPVVSSNEQGTRGSEFGEVFTHELVDQNVANVQTHPPREEPATEAAPSQDKPKLDDLLDELIADVERAPSIQEPVGAFGSGQNQIFPTNFGDGAFLRACFQPWVFGVGPVPQQFLHLTGAHVSAFLTMGGSIESSEFFVGITQQPSGSTQEVGGWEAIDGRDDSSAGQSVDTDLVKKEPGSIEEKMADQEEKFSADAVSVKEEPGSVEEKMADQQETTECSAESSVGIFKDAGQQTENSPVDFSESSSFSSTDQSDKDEEGKRGETVNANAERRRPLQEVFEMNLNINQPGPSSTSGAWGARSGTAVAGVAPMFYNLQDTWRCSLADLSEAPLEINQQQQRPLQQEVGVQTQQQEDQGYDADFAGIGEGPQIVFLDSNLDEVIEDEYSDFDEELI